MRRPARSKRRNAVFLTCLFICADPVAQRVAWCHQKLAVCLRQVSLIIPVWEFLLQLWKRAGFNTPAIECASSVLSTYFGSKVQHGRINAVSGCASPIRPTTLARTRSCALTVQSCMRRMDNVLPGYSEYQALSLNGNDRGRRRPSSPFQRCIIQICVIFWRRESREISQVYCSLAC